MTGLGVVAMLAPAHRAVELACDRALRRVPLGELMIGPGKVLAGRQSPGLERQMPRRVPGHSGELGGIVDRPVTVSALQEAFGMNVERVRPAPPSRAGSDPSS